jgi:hypothetical protein
VKWCYLVSLAASTAALGARLALAGPCPPLTVEIDAEVRSRWPEAPQQVVEAFDGREDIDACALVQLAMSGGRIALKVVLPDGRSAARALSRREDVVPTLEALLLLPRRAAPPASEVSLLPAPPPPAAPARPAAAPASQAVAARRTPSAPAREPSRVAVELSLAGGARVGDGQTGAGLGVVSFVDIARWLVGLEGRADVYTPIGGGPQAGGLQLALLVGRRLRSGTLALDLVGGPALVREGTSVTITQPAIGEPRIEMSGPEDSPRLRLGARLSFRAQAVLRTFVGLEADVGSRSDAGRLAFDMGRLPAWTVGLVLGATVGSL